AVRSGLPDKLRIGYSPDLGYAVVQSDIAAAVGEGVRTFEKLGHRVERIAGGPARPGRGGGALGGLGLAARLHRVLAEREGDFGRAFVADIQMASAMMTRESWAHVADLRERLNRWCAEVFERCDLLVTPTVPYDPPPAKGPFPTEIEGR